MPRILTWLLVGWSCCSALYSQPVEPPLAVFAARPEADAVRLAGFSGDRTIAVPPELALASWRTFGLRVHSSHRSGRPDAVVEVAGYLPRIQVRSDYQIIGFERHGSGVDDEGDGETSDRFAGIAVLGRAGASVVLGGSGERFLPVASGACVSPDQRLLAIMVHGTDRPELFVLKLEDELPAPQEVELPGGIDDLKPESLTVIDGALFVVGRLGPDGWVLLRAPLPLGEGRIRAAIAAGPFAVLKPHLAYSPAGVAFLAGDDNTVLDVHVARARATSTPFNLTLFPAPYLEHRPDSPRLAISDNASAVGYSFERADWGPETETFCHLASVPGEAGRVHVTSEERFAGYVEQEAIIFFRGNLGLVFSGGHPYEMDFYIFSEISDTRIRNLTGTSGSAPPFPPGTLTPQSAVVTGSGLLVLSAQGFDGLPGVVAVDAVTSEPVFRKVGLGNAEAFFDVGRDTYFLGTSGGVASSAASARGLYRIRNGELAWVASTGTSGYCRLLLHDADRALFHLGGTGILEMRPGAAPTIIVRGEVDPSVAVSPCGDYLVYRREGSYYTLRRTDGVTSRIEGAPDAGHVLAVGETFLRGDTGDDGLVDVEDAFELLRSLFRSRPLECPDAADANDDGALNISDVLLMLDHLYSWDAVLPPPFPDPGVDPTRDELSCCR